MSSDVMTNETSEGPLKVSRRGGVVVLCLQGRDGINTIDFGMLAALNDVLAEIARDSAARVVLLCAIGRQFCSGGDLGVLHEALRVGGAEKLVVTLGTLIDAFHGMVRRLESLDVPVVAAVNGVAAGGGLSLALAADLIYAGPRAAFVPAYPRIGLCMDGGMSWSLPRRVGAQRALELLMLNEPVSPAQAKAIGLITEFVDAPDADFEAFVDRVADRLDQGPRRAYAAIRRLLRSPPDAGLDAQLEAEAREMLGLAGGVDAAVGIQSFRAKRPPVFIQ